MTLGENIARLRAQKGWSQGDLADALNVSRQSVSKWETDGSIPELDRLVQMSELFGITLDELVRGDSTPHSASPAAPEAPQTGKARNISICLLLGGCLLPLFFQILSIPPINLITFPVALPLIACGCICLTAKRYIFLKCAWTSYLLLDLYGRVLSGFGWQGLLRFLPDWIPDDNYRLQLVIAALQLIGELLLIAFTVRAFRGAAYASTRANKVRLAVGWAVYVLRWIVPFTPPFLHLQQAFLTIMQHAGLDLVSRLLGALVCYVFAALFLVLLIRTRAFLQANKK